MSRRYEKNSEEEINAIREAYPFVTKREHYLSYEEVEQLEEEGTLEAEYREQN